MSRSSMRFRFEPHVAFPVSDRSRAVSFYERVFGMVVVGESEQETVLALGGMRFYIEQAELSASETPSGPVPNPTWFAFAVDDLDEARAALAREGCRVDEHTDGEAGLLVADPFGMRCFISEG